MKSVSFINPPYKKQKKNEKSIDEQEKRRKNIKNKTRGKRSEKKGSNN